MEDVQFVSYWDRNVTVPPLAPFVLVKNPCGGRYYRLELVGPPTSCNGRFREEHGQWLGDPCLPGLIDGLNWGTPETNVKLFKHAFPPGWKAKSVACHLCRFMNRLVARGLLDLPSNTCLATVAELGDVYNETRDPDETVETPERD